MLFHEAQQRIAEDGFESLTPTEVLIVCMWELVSEVHNGGFDQFFFNSSGDRAVEALAALRSIGAAKTAALLADLVGRFGSAGPPRDRDARVALLRVLGPADEAAFEAADLAFYAGDEDVWRLTAAYCAAHRDELHVRA